MKMVYAILCHFVPKRLVAFCILYRIGNTSPERTCLDLFNELADEQKAPTGEVK